MYKLNEPTEENYAGFFGDRGYWPYMWRLIDAYDRALHKEPTKKLGAGLGVDYDDGYLRKRWFVAWYHSEGVFWFRIFGRGLYFKRPHVVRYLGKHKG